MILTVLLGVACVQAQARYVVPKDAQVLRHLGNCNAEFLPGNFRLFVWNIKKAQYKNDWARDFEYFAPKSNLVLLQEAMIDSYMPSVVLRQQGFCWDFATSFINGKNEATGVMMGSLTIPQFVHFLRSPGREPLLKTPKMTIIAEYPLANSLETLWVANIHGLNFVTNKYNREQIDQVAAFLKNHKGPMIFAGDFNSWNNERLNYLNAVLSTLKMQHLSFADDTRTLKLDHIYARGLQIIKTDLHTDIYSSDHKPLTAEFRLQ